MDFEFRGLEWLRHDLSGITAGQCGVCEGWPRTSLVLAELECRRSGERDVTVQ